MTNGDLVTVIAALFGTGGLGALAKWAVGLWATVRREGIEAAKLAAKTQREFDTEQAAKRAAFETQLAAAARADNDKMVAALVEQARSSAALVGKLAEVSAVLGGKLDNVVDKIDELRERTPVEGFPAVAPLEQSQRTRAAGAPRTGYRSPSRAGTNHDSND